MKSRTRLLFTGLFSTLALTAAQPALAQANLPVYTDNLVNDFQDWSFSCTRVFTNTSPVHSGLYSTAVTMTGSGGSLYLHCPDFNPSPYASVTFWINGGATGGQSIQIRGLIEGNAQTPFVIPALAANTWVQYSVPLSTLGVANTPNFSGLWFQIASGSTAPVFYVDDIQLTAAAAPATVNLTVNASQVIRAADARWFGVNLADWDNNLSTQFLPLQGTVQGAGVMALRWPGGSASDGYTWSTSGNARLNTNFYRIATNTGDQAFITVNYGSGTSNLAAGWVLNANVTNHAHIKYWEIGNECYGSWENDTHAIKNDPFTYAQQAASYMALMRAADPTIKIGVVAVPGDTQFENNTNHFVRNPQTGAMVNGWTPVMLTTLSNMGAIPDFLIYHFYAQFTPTPWAFPSPSPDSDPLLLQVSTNWAGDAATLRQEINNYIGPTLGSNIELCVTENNSDSSLGCKQLSSVVNALYMVDSMSQLMKTEFNSYLWWDVQNGPSSQGDLDSTIYGWRTNGDEGIVTVNGGTTNANPNYYGFRLIQHFVRPGDSVLQSSSSYQLLSAYGARKADGSLAVLVINKDGTTNFNGQINLANYSPGATATTYTYGMAQDNATQSNLSLTLQDVQTSSTPVSGNPFTYSFPPYSMTVLTIPPAGPTLSVASVSPGAVALQLQGQTGAPYVFQSSPDLVSWSPVSTNMMSASPMTVTNPASGSQQFWRAVWVP